jgi:hypothetical protein
MIFPSIIKSEDETLDEDNDIIDPAEETNDVQA